MPRKFILFIALGLSAAACGEPSAKGFGLATNTSASISSSTTTNTTSQQATTTTLDGRPRSPVNGLPVDDPELLDRRVVAVKIDNHWNARPQSGIQEAEAVVELRVEGGLTRFMALFHSTDSTYLGPIRSGRPSDAKMAMPLDATMFISGAQAWVQSGIRDLGVPFFVDPRPGMFRIDGRSAPHDLYGNTVELRGIADGAEVADTPPPGGLWEFGPMPESAPAARQANLTFSDDLRVGWEWKQGSWLRTINGEASEWRAEDGTTGSITAEVLVVIVGEYFIASPPGSGTAVPATDSVGEGRALVFANGQVLDGTWARDDPEEPFELTTTAGSPMLVPPGYVWISLVPNVGAVGFE